MLKIKDNVDLKELEKFGFKAKYNEDTGELLEMYRINGNYIGETEKRRITATISKIENRFGKNPFKNYWSIFKNRKIEAYEWKLKLDTQDYEILYDLIQSGLVEKVEE